MIHFILLQYVQKLFTRMCMVGVFLIFSPWAKLLPAVKTFESFLLPQIWLFKLYLMPGKLSIKSILKGFEVDCFNWSLALCSDWAGSTGLANRPSVLTSRIFSDK